MNLETKNEGGFKSPIVNHLSLIQEAALLFIYRLSPESDGLVHLSRKTLGQRLGVKDPDTVSKYTRVLAEEKLIVKIDDYDKRGFNLVKYKQVYLEHYRGLGNPLYDIEPKLAAFFARLTDCAFDNTNEIYYNNREIAKRINLGERTFYTYIKQAIEQGLVEKTEEGYHLNETYYPAKKKSEKKYITPDNMKYLKQIEGTLKKLESRVLYAKENSEKRIANNELMKFKDSYEYKCWLFILKHNMLEQEDINECIDLMRAGFFWDKANVKKSEKKRKEVEQIAKKKQDEYNDLQDKLKSVKLYEC